jgi:hypothetical protein
MTEGNTSLGVSLSVFCAEQKKNGVFFGFPCPANAAISKAWMEGTMGWRNVTTREGWVRLWGPCALLWVAAAVASLHPLAALGMAVFAGIKHLSLIETIYDQLLTHTEARAPLVEINRQKALQVWWWRATGQVREAVECPTRLASWCKSWAHGSSAAFFGALSVFAWERCIHLGAPGLGAVLGAGLLLLGLRAAEMQAATADWLGRHHRLPLDAVAAPMWPRGNLGRKDLWNDG